MKKLILTLFASLFCLAVMAQSNTDIITSLDTEITMEAMVISKTLVGGTNNGNGNNADNAGNNGNAGNSGNAGNNSNSIGNTGNNTKWSYTVRLLETGDEHNTIPEQAIYSIGEHVAVKVVDHGSANGFPGQGNSDVKIMGHWGN